MQNPDVIVIGGGPAGSTTSTLIAQRSHRVQLFERDRFPRFHIGESLIPETYWVLQQLNMLPKMKASHFVKKYSVQFVNSKGKESAPFYFWDNKPHECSQTWQVVRSEFDEMMLDNAREHGVDAQEGVRVLDVLFDGDRAVGVRIRDQQNNDRDVFARVIVDASGQTAMLQNRFKLRLWDPVLNKGAIWTYWEDAYRDTGRDEGATLVMQTADRQGWFWYIPQHDNIVSLGVVAPFDYLFKNRASHQQTYEEEVERAPGVRQRLASARRVTGYFVTKDYSYRSKQVAGDGWVLVGDAFGFLDPLYSSGVLLALKSGQLAADAICDGSGEGRHVRRTTGCVGRRVQSRRGSNAPARVRILFGVQFRRIRAQISRAAGDHHGSAHRRPVHRSRRQSLGTDGDLCTDPAMIAFRHGLKGFRQNWHRGRRTS